MNKFLIIIIFFLISCSSNLSKNDFDFSNDITFDEFKIRLNEYANNNTYPNIDD